MRTPTPNIRALSSKTLIFTGGINEALSNLEMKPGECYEMLNYEEVSGEFHGYRSIMGYERIDGSEETIPNPNDPGVNITVTWASTVPLVYTDQTDLSQVDDTAREARRFNIQEVPDADYLKGSFEYADDYFAIGYDGTTGTHRLWVMKATGAVGWTEVTSFPSVIEGAGVDSGRNYQITMGRFQMFPLVANGATPNDKVVILCNGVSKAIILWKDNSGNYTCESLEEGSSPGYPAATPVLPSDTSIGTAFPIRSAIFNQRLHLAFPYGTLFVSHPGDPFAYDPAVTAGGVWWLGGEITDALVSPSSLTIFMEEGIDIIKIGDLTESGFDESKETFSDVSGAIEGTAARIMGRSIFCDERGITSLEATDRYGDFGISRISEKVQKTYQENKGSIVGAIVDREKSQYVVYFSTGKGIVLTLGVDYRGDFSVRGSSVFDLLTPIGTVREVFKKSRRLITSPNDGYLRLQHTDAESFDGFEIVSKLTTSFHSYGSNINFKTFTRLLFELSATKGQVFSMRPIFDYQGLDIPKGVRYTSDPQTDTGTWGSGIWGEFIWGGTGAVNQEYTYINGVATNMAIQFKCSSKHHKPHVVHNAIVLYSLGSIKF